MWNDQSNIIVITFLYITARPQLSGVYTQGWSDVNRQFAKRFNVQSFVKTLSFIYKTWCIIIYSQFVNRYMFVWRNYNLKYAHVFNLKTDLTHNSLNDRMNVYLKLKIELLNCLAPVFFCVATSNLYTVFPGKIQHP